MHTGSLERPLIRRVSSGLALAAVVCVTSWWSFGGVTAGEPGQSELQQRMHEDIQRMEHDMAAAPMSGDADRDFVVMMIPHHQGAIAMARTELLYGKDPVVRRLAQEIIADQQSEIDAMNLWLKKHRAPARTRSPK